MTKIKEEKVMKLREIITETSFTTPETESTLLVWALKHLITIPIDDIHTFKTTGIGKVVNRLKNHKSERVSTIAMKLIKKWKAIVHDICEKSTVTTPAPASVSASASRSAPAIVEPNAPTSSSRPSLKIRIVVGKSKPQPAAVEIINMQQQIQQVTAEKKTRGMNKEATAAVNVNTRMNNNRTDKRTTETSPAVHSSVKVSSNSRTANDKATTTTNQTMITAKKTIYEEEAAASAKSLQSNLVTTKRKLHDSYQQFENAKKQRTTKVIDSSDVPKPSAAAAAAAAGTISKAVKTSKQAAISKRLNMMKRNHLHRSKVLLPY